jgi:hypothetical protein
MLQTNATNKQQKTQKTLGVILSEGFEILPIQTTDTTMEIHVRIDGLRPSVRNQKNVDKQTCTETQKTSN